MTDTVKPSNPKDAIGSDKLPLHLWPETATALGCLAFLNGALKYGRANFREIGVRASIYTDAAKRHLNAWFEGEECDPDDGVPHLAAALGCIAIIVDAGAAGKLNDDRNIAGGYRALVDGLTPHVARLKESHKNRTPKHYTIEDSRGEDPTIGAPLRVVPAPLAWYEGWKCPCGSNRIHRSYTEKVLASIVASGGGIFCDRQYCFVGMTRNE